MTRALRFLCTALVVTYPLIVWLGVATGRPEWGRASLLALAGTVVALATRSWQRRAALFLPLAALLLLLPAHWILFTYPVALNLSLAAVFAGTLRTGHEPLIARFARMERAAPLDATLGSYARALTQVWVGFFLLMACAALVFALAAPIALWSLFTNVASYALVAALFFGEWLFRRLHLRQYHHPSPFRLLRAIKQHGAMR